MIMAIVILSIVVGLMALIGLVHMMVTGGELNHLRKRSHVLEEVAELFEKDLKRMDRECSERFSASRDGIRESGSRLNEAERRMSNFEKHDILRRIEAIEKNPGLIPQKGFDQVRIILDSNAIGPGDTPEWGKDWP
jgi:hypothetical protein